MQVRKTGESPLFLHNKRNIIKYNAPAQKDLIYYSSNEQLLATNNAKNKTIKIALMAKEMPPHIYPIMPYTIQLNAVKAI